MSDFVIGVIGNPNCGKTTLFNFLTGAKQRVGNWPGVTVDRKSGSYEHDGKAIEVVDLPGIYSLAAASIDEQISRDYILSGEAGLIINIIDASNLERNLYLTTQLLEMKVPMLLALNMMDIARSNDIRINISALARKLDCPVIPIVASKTEGTEKLKSEINMAARNKSVSTVKMLYPAEIEKAVSELAPIVEKAEKSAGKNNLDTHWIALKLIEEDELALKLVGNAANDIIDRHLKKIEDSLGEEPDIIIADSRYCFINEITKESVKKTTRVKKTISDKIDRIVLNRTWGIPIFLFAMYLMFMFTINFGSVFIDFFDIASRTILVDGFGNLLSSVGAPGWLVAILAGGIGGGIQTITTFIPTIGCMFLAISFLEDSGYMARAAFVMDRFMRFIGLPGKSFVPMLVGFGCNVPAIMATRTLENQRDRTLTIMMNPFMSCGARLSVYALFAAAFFPHNGQNMVFLLYMIGIAFAVLTGWVLKSSLLKGNITPFIMELPPYHLPTIKSVFLRAFERLKTFMFRAGRVIIAVVVVLSFLNSLGIDGTFGNSDSENSVLAAIGKSITPVFGPMGIKEENWPATVGIFTGAFAKEAVVGTLDALYSSIGKGDKEEVFNLWGGIEEALASIPANFAELPDKILDPLGLDMGNISSVEVASKEQEVSVGTFGSMVTLFDGQVGAFAYLLFVLLYIPCVASISAVYRETNMNWTLFLVVWTTSLAYLVSTIYYQLATFAQHPESSLEWIGILITVFFISFMIMKYFGRKSCNIESGMAAAAA